MFSVHQSMSAMSPIGANVRRLRLEARTSQAELARRIGKHPSLVSQIERGLCPTDEDVKRLAAALGVPEKALTRRVRRPGRAMSTRAASLRRR